MADPALTSGQYSIGDLTSTNFIVYGGRVGTFLNNIQIATTQIQPAGLANQDSPVVGHDGMLFGIDTFDGMVITQQGQIYMPGNQAGALDTWSQFAGMWNDPGVRLSIGKMAVLRAFYPGSTVIRRAYGRGRQIVPVMGLVSQGIIPFTAQFQAADNNWYSQTDNSVTLTVTPAIRGLGSLFVVPVTPFTPLGQPPTATLTNSGPIPTWPVFTITGPIGNPVVSYPNTPVSVGYRGVLKANDTLVIDTRPWARSILLNGSTSVAGLMTGDPMIGMQLPAGNTTVRYSGQDFYGTSRLTVNWRNAFPAIGGSLA